MLKLVSDIMLKEFVTVNALDGVQKVQKLVLENGVEYFPVFENNELLGVLTYKDLLRTHPNRIVADAMSTNFVSTSSNTSLWEVKEIFEKYNIDVLLVIDKEILTGLVTKTLLYMELGKHIDLLTGLYRSDYIYYNAIKLIEKGNEISVIFLDVNNFGHIDKEYGHTQGDAILKEIAMLLKNYMPSDTFLCRFGGDEFVVLTPYRNDGCVALAKHLLNIISCHKFCNDISVSIAAGIAGGKRNNKRPQNALSAIINLINLASLASTKAKTEGNGQLYVADSFEISEIA